MATGINQLQESAVRDILTGKTVSLIGAGDKDIFKERLAGAQLFIAYLGTMLMDVGGPNNFIKQTAVQLDIPVSFRLLALRPIYSDGTKERMSILLPVNPDKFDVTFKKKAEVTYTMGGFVVQEWHDDVITIVADGLIPPMYNKAKILSPSYIKFLELLSLFSFIGQVVDYPYATLVPPVNTSSYLKNSQYMKTQVLTKLTNRSAKVLKPVSSNSKITAVAVELRYLSDLYEGIFSSFTMSESYDKPNTISYKFELKAYKKKDLLFHESGIEL